MDAKAAPRAQRPEAAHDEQGVGGVGGGEVGELAFGEQNALKGHAAGVGEEGATQPRGDCLHLANDFGTVGKEAGQEAGDEAGTGCVEPADAEADEDEAAGDLIRG